MASVLFELLDENSTGFIGQAVWATLFEKLDADKDGALSRKEWCVKMDETEVFDAVKRLTVARKRQAGSVSRREWLQAFEILDKDGDGQVSRDEFESLSAAPRTKRSQTSLSGTGDEVVALETGCTSLPLAPSMRASFSNSSLFTQQSISHTAQQQVASAPIKRPSMRFGFSNASFLSDPTSLCFSPTGSLTTIKDRQPSAPSVTEFDAAVAEGNGARQSWHSQAVGGCQLLEASAHTQQAEARAAVDGESQLLEALAQAQQAEARAAVAETQAKEVEERAVAAEALLAEARALHKQMEKRLQDSQSRTEAAEVRAGIAQQLLAEALASAQAAEARAAAAEAVTEQQCQAPEESSMRIEVETAGAVVRQESLAAKRIQVLQEATREAQEARLAAETAKRAEEALAAEAVARRVAEEQRVTGMAAKEIKRAHFADEATAWIDDEERFSARVSERVRVEVETIKRMVEERIASGAKQWGRHGTEWF